MPRMPSTLLLTALHAGKKLSLLCSILHGIAIAQGLEELHSLNIIHMDLRPEHVLLTESGHVVLTGTGRACVINQQPTQILHPTAHCASFYMAPEQFNQDAGRNIVSCKADVWSLGCVLIHMLTGKPPLHDQTSKQIHAEVRGRSGGPYLFNLGFLCCGCCTCFFSTIAELKWVSTHRTQRQLYDCCTCIYT